jgi:UDPglucose 6-dehydrogenase
LDFDRQVVTNLSNGMAPIFEPGLNELLGQEIASGRLSFETNIQTVADADVLWVTFDTPVDDNDVADVEFVTQRIERSFSALKDGTVVLVSSQLPVGSGRRLEERFSEGARGRVCHFAVSPENLRLGNAISIFTHPDRIVVGVNDRAGRSALEPLLKTITDNLVWMSVESAEMTKHAINAFLATSIVFANEIATLCERVGADASQVAQGLMTESRIGPRAYVNPGAAFSGGTLSRDINFLNSMAAENRLELPLLGAVRPSNDRHRHWIRQALTRVLTRLDGATIAIFGLTYKEGTDTLRRSGAVELAEWLSEHHGAHVRAYDSSLAALPQDLAKRVALCATPQDAVRGADAVVLANNASILKQLDWSALVSEMSTRVVIDPSGMIDEWARKQSGLAYAAVGSICVS